VKVIGMSSIDEVDPEDEDRTYRSKPFWAKSLVVLSGVAANFLIAYLIFFGLALTQGQPVVVDGELVETTTVGSVVIEDENGVATTAAELGLVPEDTIVAIDGNATPEWEDLVAALESRAGEVIDVTVQRGDEELVLTGELGTRVVDGETRGFLGISPAPSRAFGSPSSRSQGCSNSTRSASCSAGSSGERSTMTFVPSAWWESFRSALRPTRSGSPRSH
jgi:membrane-associated protease RseP (regulator of RpoE activity)